MPSSQINSFFLLSRETTTYTTPFFLFLAYLGMYIFFENALGISSTFAKQTDLFIDQSFEQVKETIFRSAWGISLIISSVVNIYLLFFCVINIVKLTSKTTTQRLLLVGTIFSSSVLFIYIFEQDLGGGIAGVIYKHITSINEVAKAVDFKLAIDVVGGMGYVAVYLVSILLSYICFHVKSSPYHTVENHLHVFRTLFVSTVTFLSTTIAQLFLQYQWLTVFIPNNKNERIDIAFAYPFIMSVFYVGIIATLFIPAAEVLKRILFNRTSSLDEEITKEKISALFPKVSGVRGIIENIKSFFLFASPILTVVVAELIKTSFGDSS